MKKTDVFLAQLNVGWWVKAKKTASKSFF